ncbi:S1/P1 nuclease [Croceiramulus getboli]|nr:S1/P1 nuclease [Flavobacteriaceae bacterium YJPT1-3]
MTRLLALFLLITSFSFATPYDWGKTGHRATGEIADKYLTKKARRAIQELLDGQSLAVVSTYADEIKSDTLYRKYGPWHYVNFPFDSKYEDHPVPEQGDIIQGIRKALTVIQDESAPKKDRVFYLKLLVHFIGDLHQPLHVGRAADKGGNDIQVRWFDNGTNLHAVWDSRMIDHYGMSYTELAETSRALTKKEEETMMQGTPLSWMYESQQLVKKVYGSAQPGAKLGYRYMYDHFATVKEQLLKGGVRLAALLNQAFG